MQNANLQSSLLQTNVNVASTTPAAARVREIVEQAIAPEALPATRSVSLYHIRGVGNDKFFGGEDKDVVIYGPEFLYVLDVGFSAFPAVQLGWNASGRGDPAFPNFADHVLRSVEAKSPRELLFPCMPGHLLVGVKPGIPEPDVVKALSPYGTDVHHLVADIYSMRVKLFREREVASNIERSVDVVRYASLDRVVRLIDFAPGWFVDEVL